VVTHEPATQAAPGAQEGLQVLGDVIGVQVRPSRHTLPAGQFPGHEPGRSMGVHVVPKQTLPAWHAGLHCPPAGGRLPPPMGIQALSTQAVPDAHAVPREPQLFGSPPVLTGSQRSKTQTLFAGHAVPARPQRVGSLETSTQVPEMQNWPVPQPLRPQADGWGPETPISMGRHSSLTQASPVVQMLPPQLLGSPPVLMGLHTPLTQTLLAGHALPTLPQFDSSSKMSWHVVPTRIWPPGHC
jgi:hypothetical protein